MAGKVDWVWVDCFSRLPITLKITRLLKSLNYRLCLVSPDLQRQDLLAEIHINYFLTEKNIVV